ncbi:YceI family protein [Ichthyenterobacterium magnum]|uniref:Polyisoprenoid-binding protein YceI n=1 Tax=Ichthyenterobacterium magnum TaxID=1230530 RepID=A0A420DEN6_9FLAO|nr:YceI family protein [Ichthyenterobacterium magnum]RKE90840.1 polyisoprenoid-binding protein YceI [Ichthyenterobacterium magnum]
MKKRILNMFTIVAISIAFVSCKDKAAEANTSDAEAAAVAESTSEKYVANVAESTIEWKGFKPTGSHNGTVNIESGVFKTDAGRIKSGTFLIDMKSIVSTDMEEGEYKTSLEEHLKGTVEGKEGDFFNVTKFPTGAFEVTGTKTEDGKTMLSGNLSLKGQKHNITFPVTVSNNGDLMTIESEAFTIDRTKWGINYGSKSVFDNLGDKFINDDMELKIKIVAKKA